MLNLVRRNKLHRYERRLRDPRRLRGSGVPIKLVAAIAVLMAAEKGGGASDQLESRRVTVPDVIRMTRLGDVENSAGDDPIDRVARFSPDGRKFVVVLRKGNLENNTNEYSILLWDTDTLARPQAAPRPLLTRSSSSNRAAIKNVKWLSDNRSIAFLAEGPNELQQLYVLDIRTRILRKFTNHASNLIAYSITPDGASFAFEAEEPDRSVWNKDTMRNGLFVTNQLLFNILADKNIFPEPFGGPRLYFQGRGRPTESLATNDTIDNLGSKLCISPDGRYLLLSTRVIEVPESWKDYSDAWIHTQATQPLKPGEATWLERFELIDTRTGRNRVLLNSPLKGIVGPKAAWMPDSRSAILSGLYLPLEDTIGEIREVRKSATFSVEAEVASGETIEISRRDLKLVGWDEGTRSLAFTSSKSDTGKRSRSKVYFRKSGGSWREVSEFSQQERARMLPDVVLEEDMNTPPRIFSISPAENQKNLLLDLNPQFRGLHFAKEEEVHWKARDGADLRGGLYYPVDYVQGKRYPLVIQTHAFNPNRFWIDGPWTTAFAAQPLAGKDILVLQADESYENENSPEEVDREVARLETAIDALDQRGLIDRERVGIIGFSRTCLFVKYALTHSKYHFAAASVTDGIDGGYFQYLIASGISALDYIQEGLNGGTPWGVGMKSWLRRSPGFNMGEVQTPLLITALNPTSLLGEWEWFAALHRLAKPVELVMTKAGDHVLQKPWDRMVSQQGNVDWFAFWLKDEEDPDPAKGEQYVRWRKLRTLMQTKH
jgi:dipeptidyl aminopeptidase/acylaminoacyl peptidase